MGKEIVYCEGCGRRLFEDEFLRGKAQTLENRPYCTDCKPLAKPPTPRGTSKISSSSVPVPSLGPPPPRKVSSTRIPKQLAPPGAPPSTRRVGGFPRDNAKKKVLIGAGVGAGVLVVLIIAIASSSGGGRRDASMPGPEGGSSSSSGGSSTPEGEPEVLKQLERLASSGAEPDAILLRCDELRPSLRGTRWADRLRKVETRALELKAISDRERGQLDKFMADIKKIVQEDETCQRKGEVLQMLETARKIAGDRAAEVDRFRTDYLKRCDDAAKRQQGAAPPAAPPAPESPPPPAPAAGLQPGVDGVLVLPAEDASRHGPSIRLKGEPGKYYLGDWHTTQDWAEWAAELASTGRFRVELTYALEDRCGGDLLFTAGPQQIRGRLQTTGDWKRFQTVTLGWVSLSAGRAAVAMKAASVLAGGLMNLRALRFVPAKGWLELFQLGTGRIAANDYPGAKAIYLEALPSVPPDPPTDPQQKFVYRVGLYNLACIHSVESKGAKEAARKAAEESAFRYLDWALKTGFTDRLCACHADAWGHLEQDKDLEPLRGDPRFADLLRKYRR